MKRKTATRNNQKNSPFLHQLSKFGIGVMTKAPKVATLQKMLRLSIDLRNNKLPSPAARTG